MAPVTIETCDRCSQPTADIHETRFISGQTFHAETVPMVASGGRLLLCCVVCADTLDDSIWQAVS